MGLQTKTTSQKELPNKQPLLGTIKAVLRSFSTPTKQRNARLADGWPEIVGGKISKVATARFSENGSDVIVFANSSTLAFELSQKYGGVILKRLQNEFGENEIKKVWFRAGEPL